MERPQQFSRCPDPVAQCTAGDVQAVPCEKIFLPVERQMVAELGHDDLSNEPGPGDATGIGRAGGGGLTTPSWQYRQAYLGRT